MTTSTGFGIGEWYGQPFVHLSPKRRQAFARAALGRAEAPACPFQAGTPGCNKVGGVCSIAVKDELPVITCPRRFKENNILPKWLARIVTFSDVYLAREIPFMRSPDTGKAAGRIDMVVAKDGDASVWFGLEVQAVYFSGNAMRIEFDMLLTNAARQAPDPVGKRRPFFETIGGPSKEPSQDLNDGDIVWLVPEITADFQLVEYHWEVLSLEASATKLRSADAIKRQEFEQALRGKLKRI